MFELNLRPTWPDILVTIQKANRNTAMGKDGVHINVLKAMVLEECMMEIARENPGFQWPDNVRVDLLEDKLPEEPMTPMGKAFYSLILNVWETGCIPKQWSEVQIVNLHKGGNTDDVNNYRGISLISCAFNVMIHPNYFSPPLDHHHPRAPLPYQHHQYLSYRHLSSHYPSSL